MFENMVRRSYYSPVSPTPANTRNSGMWAIFPGNLHIISHGPVDTQVFDYVLVQSIHNATFARVLPPTFLEQARDLAN